MIPRTVIFSLCFTFGSLFVLAQGPKVSWYELDPKTNVISTTGSSSAGYLVISQSKTEPMRLVMTRYRNSEVTNTEIALRFSTSDVKNVSIDQATLVRDHIFITGLYFGTGVKRVQFAALVNLDGSVLGSILDLHEFNLTSESYLMDGSPSASVAFSPDSNVVSLALDLKQDARKNERGFYVTVVRVSPFELIWKKDQNISMPTDLDVSVRYAVDNAGNICISGTPVEEADGSDATSLLHLYDWKKGHASQKKFLLTGKTTSYPYVRFENDGTMNAFGVYQAKVEKQKAEDKTLDGYYFMRFLPGTLETVDSIVNAVPERVPTWKMRSHVVTNIIQLSNGTTAYVVEYNTFSVLRNTSVSSASGSPQMTSNSQTSYYSANAFVFYVGANGDLEGFNKLYKKQNMSVDHLLASAVVVKDKNDIFLVYNDPKDNPLETNLSTVKTFTGMGSVKITLANLKSDGSFTKLELPQPDAGDKAKKYVIEPQTTVQIGPNRYAVLADVLSGMGSSSHSKVLVIDL